MKKQLLAALLLLTLLLPFASAEEKTEAERVKITMFGRELPAELELHQVNLGCADGYLIRFGNTTVLIDGGEAWPNKPERLFPQYLEAVGVTHVDVYIVTHWHLDHCMNVNYILERWGGGSTVVYGASAEVNPDYAPLANGAIYQQMKDGDELSIGGWLTVNCVGPETVKNNGNQNMDSLNFVLIYGQKRMLFTGDMGEEEEGRLLEQIYPLTAQILKVGHQRQHQPQVSRPRSQHRCAEISPSWDSG